ncbi:HTTM domain-containing protein [Promicromonospora thailandica]|uniref:Vitamin K-dependent gamma-carboxylase n=1 Tax=Promicromonospora thailandica TaxID=765201 RepID=A0A9X2JY87_9MICO|nr:HTTM domain-containing protein [Promicromonospora thailandica]MCP2267437.1 Vitamin K-dependent gamma-carboxylase [Promicromonospora thailandica]
MTRLLDAGVRWMTRERHATYGLALTRILLGLGTGAYVAANLADRAALWGDGARWTTPAGGQPLPDLPLTVLCLGVLVVAALVTVGWRARWTVPLLLLGWSVLTAVNPLVADQGLNLARILLLYLCLADTSARWSLDARRRGRGVPGPVRTLAHNTAVLAVGAQVCLVYVLSGLFKLEGAAWRDGTAVHYPLALPQFRPWPLLADLVVGQGWLVATATWGTLALQVAFPILVLHRRLRTAAVGGALLMHAAIAVVLGLPFFSLFMMAGDCVFLRDTAVARRVAQPTWWSQRTGAPRPA